MKSCVNASGTNTVKVVMARIARRVPIFYRYIVFNEGHAPRDLETRKQQSSPHSTSCLIVRISRFFG